MWIVLRGGSGSTVCVGCEGWVRTLHWGNRVGEG